MIKNYLIVAVRNILKYKAFSLINIFGLSVAMSVCMLIILMLADQTGYDQFHSKRDRVYRILSNYEGSRQAYATSPFPLANALKTEYAIVEEATHLTPGVGGEAVFGDRIADMRGYFAEPAFFSVFSFALEQGEPRTALLSPNSMVITREMANELFQNESPIGKVIDFNDRKLPFPQDYDGQSAPAVAWGSFTVTGIIDETKYRSHLKFDVLVSASSMQQLIAEKKLEDRTNDWGWYFRTYTYALLDGAKDETDLTHVLSDITSRKYADLNLDHTKGFMLSAQPLGEVALGLMGNDTNNRLPLLGYYFLSFLAVVIMASAGLNYTNLSIARALTRAKEIGIRKVTGAFRKNLVFQFLSESVVTALLALVVAGMLLLVLAPAFKSLWLNQYLNFELPTTLSVYLAFVAFALVIGILGGLYPAMYLSKYSPIQALKHLNHMRPGKLGMRKALNVSQFVLSLFFITTSLLIYNQFQHFLTFDYGFQSENIVNVELQGADHEKLAQAIQSIPGVVMISATDIIPSSGTSNGRDLKKMGSQEPYKRAGLLNTNDHFIDNLGIELIDGRNLPPAGEGSSRYVLVNESTVRDWGYRFPSQILGEVFEAKGGDEMFEVIGVVKDFRYKLLINEDKVGPLIMRNQPARFEYLNVKLSTESTQAVLAEMESKWKAIDPAHSFRYRFFDEQLESTHRGIFDVVSILSFISFLAIVIACLGLLGMTTYTAERKTKEIGIRKILGASESSIAFLLSRGFLGVLVLSVAIGSPMSYFLNNLWLQQFPNRVEFGWETVLLGATVLVMLGALTIGSQTLMASKANAVDALKID